MAQPTPPPEGARVGYAPEYKRIGLSHVMVDFRRDDLGRMLELLGVGGQVGMVHVVTTCRQRSSLRPSTRLPGLVRRVRRFVLRLPR